MRAEVIIPIDRPTQLIQGIFNDHELVKRLAVGGNKDTLTEKATQINSFDPQEKVLFLEKTFAILSDSNPRSQDRRDAALNLLRVMDLTSVDPEGLKDSYLKAVRNLRENLNLDSDPYGEIHALLEAGKIIAPFIKNSKGIAQAWNPVANAFTRDDCQEILDDIEEIKQLTPKTFSESDARVLMLVEKGLQNQEIAAQLGVGILDIRRSLSRLKGKGIKFLRKRGRTLTQQYHSNDTGSV